MKRNIPLKFVITFTGILALATVASAMDRIVTTDAGTGAGSLTDAINALADGDRIVFHIPPEAGEVHYINTPVGGYPVIHNANITIDGYTQGGASPNTASIHATNNAQIKICLTSTNGNAMNLYRAATNLAGVVYTRFGYGEDEQPILGFFRATNALVRGLAILSSPTTDDGNGVGGDCKSISFAADAPDVGPLRCENWRVSGCWFGVDPVTRKTAYMYDGVTVATPVIAIAAYRTRQNAGVSAVQYPQPGTIGVAAATGTPREDFNVFVTGYGFDSEGLNFRISGNFWGFEPDGTTPADMSVLNGGTQLGDGYIEIGRDVSNSVIGTDGDGVNDDQEGNLFGPLAEGGATCMDFYSSPHNNIKVAGNWFNKAVNGTKFENQGIMVNSFANTATVIFGSDFDGVSDAAEANVICSMTNALNTVLNGTGGALSVGARVSFRGNVTDPDEMFPYHFANGSGSRLNNFTNYSNLGMVTAGNDIIPKLTGSTSGTTHLTGSCAPAQPAYNNKILDLYIADPSSLKYGAQLNYTETGCHGFPNGLTYLGSYVVDGGSDLDANPNSFDFDISALGLSAGTLVTATVTYSQDPAGTHNGRAHTSNFSRPLPLGVPQTGTVNIDSIVKSGSTATITWTGGVGPFCLQKRSPITGAWSVVTVTGAHSATDTAATESEAYYEICW